MSDQPTLLVVPRDLSRRKPRPPRARYATCPECRAPCGMPVCEMANGHDGPPDSTLGCGACGHGWVGTDDEVDRALRKNAAYLRSLKGEEPSHG